MFNSLRAGAAAELGWGDPAALPPTENQINRMPDELLVMILRYLKPQDLVNCKAVCRRWDRVAGDNALWRQHFIFPKSLGRKVNALEACRLKGSAMRSNVLHGHTNRISCVAVAEGRIISGSNDTTLRIWGLDGRPLATLEGHTRWVTCVAVAEGRIISGSVDSTLRIWSVRDELTERPALTGDQEARPAKEDYV